MLEGPVTTDVPASILQLLRLLILFGNRRND